jgi:GNAT superfamily N-acetyltransferase
MASAFDVLPDGASLSVAVDPSGAVLGVLFLETRHDYFTGAPHGHVGVLAIAESAEGRGLGRTLLARADAWGRAQGFDRLTLTVFDGNVRARRLYERAGYRPDLVRYRKDLRSES